MAQSGNILLPLTVAVAQEFRKGAQFWLRVSHTVAIRQQLKQPGAAQEPLSLYGPLRGLGVD